MIDLEHFRGKRCLLLLGPVGPFFYRFAKDLKTVADKVYKINFSGGDFIFYPKGAISYKGSVKDWPKFLKEFCEENKINTIFLLNDCKFVHRGIKTYLEDKIRKRELEVWVFEEGYIRPDYITLELNGVNGNSQIPKDPEIFRSYKKKYPDVLILQTNGSNKYWYFYSFLYFIFYLIFRPFFPASKLSYPNIHKAFIGYILNFTKKIYHDFIYSAKVKNILQKYKGKYYFVPLQVFNDSQIRFHSSYKDVKEFIEEVLYSFSQYAPREFFIILKHHPLDIGFRCYKNFIERLSAKLGIKERVFYFKIGDVKTFIENSVGVITINSTVGMTALLMKKPVKVMGKAIYDIKGLTFQGSLDEFWIQSLSFKISEEILKGLIAYLQDNILINGNFYKKITDKCNTGIIYNPSYHPDFKESLQIHNKTLFFTHLKV